MKREQRASPFGLLDAAVHELAQPAASAGLALELAADLLGRGDTGAAERKIQHAVRHIQSLQRRLIGLGSAAALSPENVATDFAPLVAHAFPSHVVKGRVFVAVAEETLVETLACIARTIQAEREDIWISTAGASVTMVVVGRGAPTPALKLWLATLRRSGCSASCAPRLGQLRVMLRLPRCQFPATRGRAVPGGLEVVLGRTAAEI